MKTTSQTQVHYAEEDFIQSRDQMGEEHKMKPRSQEAIDAQIGEYEVGRLIGSGMIGVVAVARHYITKEIVVLKCMSW